MHLSWVNQGSKQTTPTVLNCVCSNALFCLKNYIFEFFSTQIFAMKVDESIKTIFYRAYYPTLWKEANLKTEHTYFSRLCVVKRIILFQKQDLRIFQQLKQMSQRRPVPISLSKVSVWMHPRLKTVSAQICRFIWKTTFSSFYVLKYL